MRKLLRCGGKDIQYKVDAEMVERPRISNDPAHVRKFLEGNIDMQLPCHCILVLGDRSTKSYTEQIFTALLIF